MMAVCSCRMGSGEHPKRNNKSKCKRGGIGMGKIKQVLGTSLASLGLVVGMAGGFAGATTAGTIDTTGPGSENEIKYSNTSEVNVENENDITATNHNHQNASTAEAEVEHNTTGGSAKSGNASNVNSFSASATISNAGSGAIPAGNGGTLTGSIENTGPYSENEIDASISSEVEIENNNDLSVVNTNCQTATSGSAEVSRNTTGGDATSGNASNTSTTSATFTVSN